MKFTKLLILSSLFLLTGCNGANNANDPSAQKDIAQEVTVFTNNDDWKNEFSGGSGFVDADMTDNSANRAKFLNYLNKSKTYVESIECSGAITSLNYGEMDPNDNSKQLGVGLAIGGGSKLGNLTLTFDIKPISVTIYALAYYKKYKTYEGDPNNGLSKDTASQLVISSDDESQTLDLRGTQEMEIKSVFSRIEDDQLVISNKSSNRGRVIIDKIVFAFPVN